MNLGRFIFAAALCIGAGLSSSCTSAGERVGGGKQSHTFALAVAVRGGGAPSAAQWAALEEKFAVILRPSDRLSRDPTRADDVVHIFFAPDSAGSNGGTATILAVVPNDHADEEFPWRRVISPDADPRGFELVMEALMTP